MSIHLVGAHLSLPDELTSAAAAGWPAAAHGNAREWMKLPEKRRKTEKKKKKIRSLLLSAPLNRIEKRHQLCRDPSVTRDHDKNGSGRRHHFHSRAPIQQQQQQLARNGACANHSSANPAERDVISAFRPINRARRSRSIRIIDGHQVIVAAAAAASIALTAMLLSVQGGQE